MIWDLVMGDGDGKIMKKYSNMLSDKIWPNIDWDRFYC